MKHVYYILMFFLCSLTSLAQVSNDTIHYSMPYSIGGGFIPPNIGTRIGGQVGQQLWGMSGSINNRQVIAGFWGAVNAAFPIPKVIVTDASNNRFSKTVFTGFSDTVSFTLRNVWTADVSIDSITTSGISILDTASGNSFSDTARRYIVFREFFVDRKPGSLLANGGEGSFSVRFTAGGSEDLSLNLGTSGERFSIISVYANHEQQPQFKFIVGAQSIIAHPISKHVSDTDPGDGVPVQRVYHGYGGRVRDARTGTVSDLTFRDTLRFGVYEKGSKALATSSLSIISSTPDFTPSLSSMSVQNGIFKYVPSSNDKYPFEVAITAGGTTDTMLIEPFLVVKPQSISYGLRPQTYELPDPADISSFGMYAFTDSSAASALVRIQQDTVVKTTEVFLVGKTLRIDNGRLTSAVQAGSKPVNLRNMRRLLIIGEDVQINGELKAEGADVGIYSRKLTFGTGASINTRSKSCTKDSVGNQFRCDTLAPLSNIQLGGSVSIVADTVILPTGKKLDTSIVKLNTDPARSTLDTSGWVAARNNGIPAWLHPALMMTITSYARECYMRGLHEYTDSLLNEYISLANIYRASPLYDYLSTSDQEAWEQSYDEMNDIVSRLSAQVDYFGHPIGWVPRLSLEANASIFDKEATTAASAMYLAYVLRKSELNADVRAQALEQAVDGLDQHVQELRDEYLQLDSIVIPQLLDQGRRLADSVQKASDSLKTLEQELTARATTILAERERVRAEEARRAASKARRRRFINLAINGALFAAQVVPFGQPALAMAARIVRTAMAAREALRNINWRKPLDPKNIQAGMRVVETWKNPGFSSAKEKLDLLIKSAGDLGIDKRFTKFAQTANDLVDKVGRLKGQITSFKFSFPNLKFSKETLDSLKKIASQFKGVIDSARSIYNEGQDAKDQIENFADAVRNTNFPAQVKGLLDEIAPRDPSSVIPRLPENEFGSILAELRANEPRFGQLFNRIADLSAQQEVVGAQTVQAMSRASRIPTEIGSATLTTVSMVEQLATIASEINPMTYMFIYDMDRRAQERLIKYNYYIAKAYEYRMLQAFRQRLDFSGIAVSVLNEFDKAATSPNPLDLSLVVPHIKEIFRTNLNSISNTIIDQANTGIGSSTNKTGTASYRLGPEQLQKLLKDGKLSLNLFELRRFGIEDNDVRIKSITVKSISARRIDGIKDGKLDIQFYHSGDGDIFYNNEKIHFIVGNPADTNPKPVWITEYHFDDNSLIPQTDGSHDGMIRYFSGVGETTELFNPLPGCSDILIVTQSQHNYTIDSLQLGIQYEYRPRGQNSSKHLNITALPAEADIDKIGALQPLFVVQKGTSTVDARGDLRQYYSVNDQVKVTAPKNFGGWRFQKWTNRIDGAPQVIPDSLSRNPQQTLTISNDVDVIARYLPPIYAGKIVPTIDTAQSTISLRFIGRFADEVERDSTESNNTLFDTAHKVSQIPGLKIERTGNKSFKVIATNVNILPDPVPVILEAEYALPSTPQYVLVKDTVWIPRKVVSGVNNQPISVTGGTSSIASIRPNPANNEITLALHLVTGVSVLEIVNASGNIIMSKNITSENGYDQNLVLPVTTLPSGVYKVILKSGTDVLSSKSFIVIH